MKHQDPLDLSLMHDLVAALSEDQMQRLAACNANKDWPGVDAVFLEVLSAHPDIGRRIVQHAQRRKGAAQS